ncbi:thermonuclease family protein [Ilumatobacter sp.]|uniref:thermonuclease family protein n=1 Tax=Ilumatobacter sp. TaxID=1967498 RepID=UPI003B51EF84
MALTTIVAACDGSETDVPAAAGALEPNATVEGVVDGDTIDVAIDGRSERVRLIGIDTPETKRPNSPVECFGPEASAHVATLIAAGTAVRIERDVVPRDVYGRLLGYVFRAEDGLFVNDEMVRRGFARPLTIEPNSAHARRFVESARTAEADDLGLWANCS